MFGRTARFASVADFHGRRIVRNTVGVVLAERIQRSFASVTSGALKSLHSRNEMARDEHQLEIEGSRHVLDGRETRVHRGTLEIGDLSLSHAEFGGQVLLTELLSQARVAKPVGYHSCAITYT